MNNEDVDNQYINMYLVTNKFPELSFCGPHIKPYGVRGLSKNYHIYFDPKLGHGTCAILRIICSFTKCTSMLDQPWTPSFPPHQKP